MKLNITKKTEKKYKILKTRYIHFFLLFLHIIFNNNIYIFEKGDTIRMRKYIL